MTDATSGALGGQSLRARVESWIVEARGSAAEGDARARRRALGALLFFGSIFAAMAIYLVGWESDPSQPWPQPRWTKDQEELGFYRLALGATLAVAAYFVLRRVAWLRGGLGRRATIGALMLMVAGSGLYYFSAVHGLRNANYSHRWDTYHYLLGPKYYDEIDYYDLYRCTAQAVPQIPDSAKTKHLDSYKGAKVGELRAQASCEAQFTPERWEEFKSDLAVYGEGNRYRAVAHMMRDLGYNGTPSHSVIAGWVANHIDLSAATLAQVPLIDIAFLCIGLGAMVWAFGWRLGLTVALFFFVDACDRYSTNGGSFFRHFWSMSLFLGVACLGRRRYGWAGFWLTASTAMNVFPLVFMLGLAAKGAVEWWRSREFPVRFRVFVLGAAVAAVLFGTAGASSARGVGAYTSFFENMETHNVRGRFPGYGVGLKFNFVDYGRVRTKTGTSASSKAKAFEGIRDSYRLLALSLIAVGLWASTRLEDHQAAVLAGLTIMFCQLETTGYYFIVFALLVTLWRPDLLRPGGAAMLIGLFGANLWCMRSLVEDNYYYFFNVSITSAFTLYLVATLVYFAYTRGVFAQLLGVLFPLPSPEAASEEE